jgi:septum formation protein
MKRIILASASPRRHMLLSKAFGFDFEVCESGIDEDAVSGFSPEETVKALSRKKALCVAEKTAGDAVIIAADTVVSINGEILNKPTCTNDAFRMLKTLQGKAHTVYTGVCLMNIINESRDERLFSESARVFMRPLSADEINAYIATGEPMDKAGAYGIQEKGGAFIERVEGDYFCVVGLPIHRLYPVFREWGII